MSKIRKKSVKSGIVGDALDHRIKINIHCEARHGPGSFCDESHQLSDWGPQLMFATEMFGEGN